MKTRRTLFAIASVAVVLGLQVGHASDRTGCYAIVDKVVLEPSEQNPERIQIWGTFAMPAPNDVNLYEAPQQGYLYFSLPASNPQLARREWADLRRIAGKGQVVGFGGRFTLKARVRHGEQPAPGAPDTYDVASGVVQLGSDTSYAPIKSLLEFRTR